MVFLIHTEALRFETGRLEYPSCPYDMNVIHILSKCYETHSLRVKFSNKVANNERAAYKKLVDCLKMRQLEFQYNAKCKWEDQNETNSFGTGQYCRKYW